MQKFSLSRFVLVHALIAGMLSVTTALPVASAGTLAAGMSMAAVELGTSAHSQTIWSHLADAHRAAQTLAFTSTDFTAMTGQAEEQFMLLLGEEVSAGQHLLLLLPRWCIDEPMIMGIVTVTETRANDALDRAGTVELTWEQQPLAVDVTVIGADVTLRVDAFNGWSGLVDGHTLVITARAGAFAFTATVFVPVGKRPTSSLTLTPQYSVIADLSDETINCDGLTPRQCFELRKCFRDYATCLKNADDTYDSDVDACGDLGFTAMCAGGGAGTGAGLGAAIGSCVPIVGTGIGAAVGGFVGLIAGGCTGYYVCLRNARFKRDAARVVCVNNLANCLENWIDMP